MSAGFSPAFAQTAPANADYNVAFPVPGQVVNGSSVTYGNSAGAISTDSSGYYYAVPYTYGRPSVYQQLNSGYPNSVIVNPAIVNAPIRNSGRINPGGVLIIRTTPIIQIIQIPTTIQFLPPIPPTIPISRFSRFNPTHVPARKLSLIHSTVFGLRILLAIDSAPSPTALLPRQDAAGHFVANSGGFSPADEWRKTEETPETFSSQFAASSFVEGSR